MHGGTSGISEVDQAIPEVWQDDFSSNWRSGCAVWIRVRATTASSCDQGGTQDGVGGRSRPVDAFGGRTAGEGAQASIGTNHPDISREWEECRELEIALISEHGLTLSWDKRAGPWNETERKEQLAWRVEELADMRWRRFRHQCQRAVLRSAHLGQDWEFAADTRLSESGMRRQNGEPRTS